MKKKLFYVRKTKTSDLKIINSIYYKVTGIRRSITKVRWEWISNKNINYSWVILYNNKIVGHHGYVKIPFILNKKKFYVLRTENSMLLREYREKIPYFFLERKILSELKKKFKLLITTAGNNAPLKMRKLLGYTFTSNWDIYLINNNLVNRIKNKISNTLNLNTENNLSLLYGQSLPYNIILNPPLNTICKEAYQNLRKDYISLYPSKAYLNWRFVKNPYHKYFSSIIQIPNSKGKIIIFWYEIRKALNFHDIVIEYLNFPVNNSVFEVLRIISRVFNAYNQSRLVYRVINMDKKLGFKEGNNSKLLIYYTDRLLKNYSFYFDSGIRQGISS